MHLQQSPQSTGGYMYPCSSTQSERVTGATNGDEGHGLGWNDSPNCSIIPILEVGRANHNVRTQSRSQGFDLRSKLQLK